MMTLTASPLTIKAPIAITRPRPVEAAPTRPARPGFWTTLLRALAASAA